MGNDITSGMPTLRDVARLAKVSLATADRVVNRRPGVRDKTIERVEAAVRELGFERHAGAAALARRTRFKAVALVPRGANPFISRLSDELMLAARTEGLRRLDLDLVEADTFAPDRLAKALRLAAEGADGIIAVGLDDETVGSAIDAIQERGIPVVTLVSDVPGSARHRYVGIDNQAAGRVAASLVGRFAAPGEGSVIVLLGSLSLRDHRDRLDGFREVMEAGFPGLAIVRVLEGQDDREQTREAVARALSEGGVPTAVYSIGGGISGLAEALAEHDARPIVVAHELTAETLPLLSSGAFDALIVQDPGHEARSAVRVLMSALTGAALSEDQERIRIEILVEHNLPK